MIIKLTKTLPIVLALWSGIYFIFSFGHWAIHPAEWDSALRGVAATLMLIVAAFTFLLSISSETNTSNKKPAIDISKEGWGKKLPILEAYSKGEKIEFLANGEWIEAGNECGFKKPHSSYRILGASN